MRLSQAVANLILSEVLRLLPDEEAPILLPAASLGELAQLLGEGSINSSTGRRVLEALWGKGDISPRTYVEKEGLFQIRSREELLPVVHEVLTEQPKSVASYRKGKTSALQALLGQAMRKTSGRGDPVMIEKLLTELLNAEA